MNNENLNKENLENSSLDSQNYISEIPDKKNILSVLLDKFKAQKEKREQKLLNPAEHRKTQVTNRSITSLWNGKSFLSNIFTSLDSVRKSITEKFSTPLPQNTLATEIIGKDSIESKENDFSKNNTVPSPIFPKVKTASKTIIDNTQKAEVIKIEVSKINTSAIEKDTEISDDKEAKGENLDSTQTDSKQVDLEQKTTGYER